MPNWKFPAHRRHLCLSGRVAQHAGDRRYGDYARLGSWLSHRLLPYDRRNGAAHCCSSGSCCRISRAFWRGPSPGSLLSGVRVSLTSFCTIRLVFRTGHHALQPLRRDHRHDPNCHLMILPMFTVMFGIDQRLLRATRANGASPLPPLSRSLFRASLRGSARLHAKMDQLKYEALGCFEPWPWNEDRPQYPKDRG